MNPPSGGWTPENMPSPSYKLRVIDGCIGSDVLLTTASTDLQAGYAMYNGSWVLCKGKDLDLPEGTKYVLLTIDANIESSTFTTSFELSNEVKSSREDLKQVYPIAKIFFSEVDGDESDSSSEDPATAHFNACQIAQYPISVPQLWSFKVCIDESDSGS
ncbi:hypothetical protein SDC9_205247 [bioreactor metagenome]|uniref:Uncharacterized protein n=1 Tax=bioreactor metagenome TaxID=1076179 RepID=A0A645JDC1_9ZZZZ